LLKILYGDSLRGVADGYSLSRSHSDLLRRDFPTVRDGESADAVIIDGDVLGGNAVLLLCMIAYTGPAAPSARNFSPTQPEGSPTSRK
jgi:hypothetical protein